jgi:ATP-dependent DNA ligase
MRLVYYAFDLLHFEGWEVSNLPLTERTAVLDEGNDANMLRLDRA